MKVYHIGTIGLETNDTEREIKSIGGIGGYILELIDYSLMQGCDIGLIGKIYNYSRDSQIEYVEVQRKVTGTISFLLHLLKNSFVLKIPSDSILHAHRPDHLALILLLNRRYSIVTLHGQQAKTVKSRKGPLVRVVYDILESYALRRVDHIIAVDDITKDFYLSLYPHVKNKLSVIPTGVNLQQFYPSVPNANIMLDLEILATDNVILYVGRIEPPKRIDILLKAFKSLQKSLPDCKLLLVGDGVDRLKMEELSVRLGVNDSVSFLGVRKRNELVDYFNLAKVSVLLSNNEGSPLSVKESLACGVPVLANDVGDVSSVIINGFNGEVVDLDNIDLISSTLKKLIKQHEFYSSNCVQSVKKYSIDAVNNNVINLYKQNDVK